MPSASGILFRSLRQLTDPQSPEVQISGLGSGVDLRPVSPHAAVSFGSCQRHTQHMGDHIPAVICFCVAVLAELFGGFGVARAAFGVRKVKEIPTMVEDDGFYSYHSDQVDALVKAQALPVASLVVFAIGILAGFLGNVLSL